MFPLPGGCRWVFLLLLGDVSAAWRDVGNSRIAIASASYRIENPRNPENRYPKLARRKSPLII